MTREPRYDDGGGKAEHDVQHDGGHVIADTRARVVVVAPAQEAVHRIADHARKEHNEGVHYPLDQRHGDHVAVGDVGNLMADHGFDFFARHALQQAGGYGHERGVLERAGGKRIGLAFKDADFGHADAGLVGQAANGLHDPGFIGVARVVDDPHARAPLGHGLADQQRDDRAAKTHDEREAQQHGQVQAVGREEAVHAQQAGDDSQHHDDGEVGEEEQGNAFHVFFQEEPLRGLCGNGRGKRPEIKIRPSWAHNICGYWPAPPSGCAAGVRNTCLSA